MGTADLVNGPEAVELPVLMDVHCCNCQMISTWQVEYDYGHRMLGETVYYECICGPGNTIGVVRKVTPIGEAGR